MPSYVETPSLVTINTSVKPHFKDAFADWQAKLNLLVTKFPRFVSIEFLCPKNDENWVIVLRLSDSLAASEWLRSQEHRKLIDDLANISEKIIVNESESEDVRKESVTQVIVTQVCEEKEEEYREWTAKIHQEEAKYPGFQGVYVQSPATSEKKSNTWITLLQFDTQEHLDNWLNSDERKKILSSLDPLTKGMESHRVMSPYAGWFASIAKTGRLPALWKQTMLVLLVLFPIVMLEFKFLSPLLSDQNISFSTFIGNAISVSLISFPLMPIALFFLGWWLSPKGKNQDLITLSGALLILVLYALEIFIFWNFV